MPRCCVGGEDRKARGESYLTYTRALPSISHQLHPASRRGSSGSRSVFETAHLFSLSENFSPSSAEQQSGVHESRSKSTVIYVERVLFKTGSEAERQVRFVVVGRRGNLVKLRNRYELSSLPPAFSLRNFYLCCGRLNSR